MKLTRFALILLLIAGGCRFAESKRTVAARRLTELLLTPIVAMQTPQPVSSPAPRPAEQVAGVTSSATPAVEQQSVARPGAAAPPQIQRDTLPSVCPQAFVARRATAVMVRTAATTGRQSGSTMQTLWIRVVHPDAAPCERAKLSGS